MRNQTPFLQSLLRAFGGIIKTHCTGASNFEIRASVSEDRLCKELTIQTFGAPDQSSLFYVITSQLDPKRFENNPFIKVGLKEIEAASASSNV